MKRISFAGLMAMVAVAVTLAGVAAAQRSPRAAERSRTRGPTIAASVMQPLIVAPRELRWASGPPALPAGARVAPLDGDHEQAERLFALRLSLPAGYRIMPHWHPADEHVTVISGEVAIGHGDRFDESSMQRLPAGGYIVLPARHHHFAMARTESVIQLHGVGPWQIHYLNPADDPRTQARR